MKKWCMFEKYLFLFFIGGSAYYCLEVFIRGFSHYSMFLCGGVCFIGCGLINESGKLQFCLLSQMMLSSLFITAVEFVTGCVVNLWMNLDVWDYSKMPYNFKGQICLYYSIVWFLLSALVIMFDDYLRFWFFGEEKPRYKIL